MKYTVKNYSVYAGKNEIARAYVGSGGYEVRVLQGVPRDEVRDKIIADCPEYAKEYNIKPNSHLYLFSK